MIELWPSAVSGFGKDRLRDEHRAPGRAEGERALAGFDGAGAKRQLLRRDCGTRHLRPADLGGCECGGEVLAEQVGLVSVAANFLDSERLAGHYLQS